MFKKIAIVYSSIMFVMLFVVMMLLISVMLLDINSDQKNNIAHDPTESEDLAFELGQEISSNLKIETDKNSYAPAEKVLINFENTGDGRIVQNNNSNLTIKSRLNMGKNYEVAFIEKQNGNDWIAIEPVNRCSNDCSKPCTPNKHLSPNNREVFTWNQTMIECLSDSEQITKNAPTGVYRVVSASWNSESNQFEKIHSNTFQISNLSIN